MANNNVHNGGMPAWNKALALLVAVVVVVLAGWAVLSMLSVGLLGPMVQMVTPHSFTIVWDNGQNDEALVKVAQKHGDWSKSYQVTPRKDRYELTVDGLSPSTAYEYIIYSGGADSDIVASATTKTAPQAGEPFRILAFGDSGWGESGQFQLAELMPRYQPRVIVHTGDLIYMEGADEDYPAKFYEPYRELIAAAPFYPSIGNHDWDDPLARPYYKHFVLPENGPQGSERERHYWFDFGDVRFVAIDTDATFEELSREVQPWLEQLLSADRPWKIVYFHHPYYTSSKHGQSGKVRQLFVPLFDKYHVDLVLGGHNHIYERTFPLRDDEIVEPGSGTIYVTTGAGGARLYPAAPEKPDWMDVQVDMVYSFTILDLDGDRIEGRQIGLDNKILDEFTILRNTGTASAAESQPATATSN